MVFERQDPTIEALAIQLQSPDTAFTDSLIFGGEDRASLRLPPNVYRYQLSGRAGSGIVAVESYSDEYHPRPVGLWGREGGVGTLVTQRSVRERWWMFGMVIVLLTAGWVWRRRAGLP